MKPTREKIDAFPELQPGDILLYGGDSLVSWLIQFRTWSDVAHVEVYAGNGLSLASRAEGVPFTIDAGCPIRWAAYLNGIGSHAGFQLIN